MTKMMAARYNDRPVAVIKLSELNSRRAGSAGAHGTLPACWHTRELCRLLDYTIAVDQAETEKKQQQRKNRGITKKFKVEKAHQSPA